MIQVKSPAPVLTEKNDFLTKFFIVCLNNSNQLGLRHPSDFISGQPHNHFAQFVCSAGVDRRGVDLRGEKLAIRL